MVVYENFFEVQAEFSVESTTKKFLIVNPYKTIYRPVRSDCSPGRVYIRKSYDLNSVNEIKKKISRSSIDHEFIDTRVNENFLKISPS